MKFIEKILSATCVMLIGMVAASAVRAGDESTVTKSESVSHVSQSLAAKIVEQATSLSACRKSDPERLVEIAARIVDLNKSIIARQQIIESQNKLYQVTGGTDAGQIANIQGQLQLMDEERNSQFDQYKKLGGIETAAETVRMLPSSCKPLFVRLNSNLSLLFKDQNMSDTNSVGANAHELHCTKPTYPKIPLSNNESGAVRMTLLASEDGEVIYTYMDRSSGSRILDRAALESASTCKLDSVRGISPPKLIVANADFVYHLDAVAQPDISINSVDQKQIDSDRSESNAQLTKKITDQINLLGECTKTDRHKLSELAHLIRHMHQWKYKSGATMTLFANYKKLGGIADTVSEVQEILDPCDVIDREVRVVKAEQRRNQPTDNPFFVPAKFRMDSVCAPLYPQLALRNEEAGKVRISVLANTAGSVSYALLEKSSGYPLLDNAALDGLSKCKVDAAFYKGVQEQSWLDIDYVFVLKD